MRLGAGRRFGNAVAIYAVNEDLTDQETDGDTGVGADRPESDRANRGTSQYRAESHRRHNTRRNIELLQRITPPIQRVSAK